MPNPRRPDEDKRSVERKRAEKMYLDAKGDIKLVDIAKKLGVPANKVRKWKSVDDWEGKLYPSRGKKKQVERSTSSKGERSTKDEGSVPRKRGGQPGNKNGGNPSPIPPIKHGGFSKRYFDMLDEEEQELIDSMGEDQEMNILLSIKMLTLRERAIMKAIKQYQEKPLYISEVTSQKRKRTFKNEDEQMEYERLVQEKIDKGERMPGEPEMVTTVTQATVDLTARLQRELTSVTNQKLKAIEALTKLQADKADGEAEGSVIKIWADKIRAIRAKGGDEDD